MTLKQMKTLVSLQNELCERSQKIESDDIFVYTIGIMIERWCMKNKKSPAEMAKKLYKRLRRKR
jgi:hypothetical protein